MKTVVLTPKGICAKSIVAVLADDGTINNLTFIGGCKGGLAAIGGLVKGMTPENAAARMEGIQCRGGTSCPDQFAKLIKAYMKAEE